MKFLACRPALSRGDRLSVAGQSCYNGADIPAGADVPDPADASTAATGQPPEPSGTDVPYRCGYSVAIDVAVVDRNGRPVEDLRAPDFAVKIDGEVRRVVSAESHQSRRRSGEAAGR